MDAATLAAVEAEVNLTANTIGGVLEAIAPQFHVPIVLGKAVAAISPELVNDVEQWIEKIKNGQDPTDDENKALAASIASLKEPEGPGLA